MLLKRIASTLWGEFESKEEVQKFGLLASIFFFIIGTYWALRPMKDSIFNALVGIDYQPRAKWLSLVVVFPLVIFYSKLIDMFPRQRVFYFLVAGYAILAFCFYLLFSSSNMGLLAATKSVYNWHGWAWYVYVESFGSLIVALFWAIATDITLPDAAKRGFPMIGLGGQLGNIVGPFILNTQFLGVKTSAPIVAICSALMICAVILLFVFLRVTPSSQLVGYHGKVENKEHESEPGFLEGLRLLVSNAYLLSIFAIVTIYEVLVTVFDFHFKKMGAVVYTNEATYQTFLAQYATMTGVVATICILFGISNIQRRLGVLVSLVLLPPLIGVAAYLVWHNPENLRIAFWIMVTSKAINYVLNQPTLKQLYIPTTHDTRYKAQAWSDMFGSRGSKAVGSALNDYRVKMVKDYELLGLNQFLTLFLAITVGSMAGWLFAAWYLAKTYNRAIQEKRVVC